MVHRWEKQAEDISAVDRQTLNQESPGSNPLCCSIEARVFSLTPQWPSSPSYIYEYLSMYVRVKVWFYIAQYPVHWTAQWRERKCPNFETVAKGIWTRDLSLASPAFYHWAIALHNECEWIVLETWLNASQRSQVGVEMNMSAMGWSMKGFEQSNGLHTALYKDIPLPFYNAIHNTLPPRTCL